MYILWVRNFILERRAEARSDLLVASLLAESQSRSCLKQMVAEASEASRCNVEDWHPSLWVLD